MLRIRSEDKTIVGSRDSHFAVRASAPGGAEVRLPKPAALLLSGLILIGVAALPGEDLAYGTPPAKDWAQLGAELKAARNPYEKCLARTTIGVNSGASITDRRRVAQLVCDQKHKGIAISPEDQKWINGL